MAASGISPDKIARYGGMAFVFLVLQFLVFMVIAQLAYPCTNGICYNVLTNAMSDLGNTATSPLWPMFNYSGLLRGMLFFVGLILLGIAGTFRKGKATTWGLVLLAVFALCNCGLTIVPENTIYAIHIGLAAIEWPAGGLGVLLLGLSMRNDKIWKNYATFSIVAGVFTLIMFVILAATQNSIPSSGPGIGFGAVERLTLAPTLLWTFLIGLKLLRKQNR